VNSLTSFIRKLWPKPDPEGEAEAKRIRDERDTIRASQASASTGNVGSLPPTPDVLDPKRDD
jgi:hypothetical protein